MSFGMSGAGYPGHVAHQLRLQAQEAERYSPDDAQRERALELTLAELADMPVGKDVAVEAHGHADEHGRTITISVRSYHRYTGPDPEAGV